MRPRKLGWVMMPCRSRMMATRSLLTRSLEQSRDDHQFIFSFSCGLGGGETHTVAERGQGEARPTTLGEGEGETRGDRVRPPTTTEPRCRRSRSIKSKARVGDYSGVFDFSLSHSLSLLSSLLGMEGEVPLSHFCFSEP